MAPIARSLLHTLERKHALYIFHNINFLGEDKLIFTIDFTGSLYTVIPNHECTLALKHILIYALLGFRV